MPSPPLHPLLEPLASLVGTWQGTGTGSYPTIDDFEYREELAISHGGKPFLTLHQRTRLMVDDSPSHTEVGYLRALGEDRVELVVAQPTGVAETLVGTVASRPEGVLVALASTAVASTPTAKSVTATERRLVLEGDLLVEDTAMAAVGEAMTHHVRAELRRT